MQRKWLAIFVLVLGWISLGAHEQDLLKSTDISRIMKQIFSEHVEKREVTEQILHQAWETYINQFDPYRIYLLESEVSPYFNATPENLQRAIAQYKANDYSKFYELNKTIQIAIERSRRIRDELESDEKNSLFPQSSDKKRTQIVVQESLGAFPKTKEQLKERIIQNIESYIEQQKKRYGEAMTPERKQQLLHSYELKLRDVENQYLYQNEKDGVPLTEVEQENLFALHVLKALASSLDSHTTFFEANEAFDIRIKLQKEFKGIGLVLKDTDEGAMVVHMLEGGAAANSRVIQVGDILTAVDGQQITDYSFEKTMELLHGDKSTTVKLVFKRKEENGAADHFYTVDLKRETIIVNKDRVDVRSEAFGEGLIGVITLHSFYQGEDVSSEKDIRDAVQKLEDQGNLKGLVLDLRDNGGGFLSQAVKVAGLFITDGVIVIAKYANGEEKIYRDVDGKTIFDGPLVVLTSKATASAAEIVAQALQDYGVALIVGDEHTYGKGTIQTQTVTDNQSSSYFKVTVGKYYTVSGNSPQKEGVKADIIAPSHWHKEEIGERYADTVDGGTIPPFYDDKLSDVPTRLRSWYIKYYIPKMQKRVSLWRDLLPTLRKNSEYRIAHNKNYQYFLKGGAPASDDDDEVDDEWDEVEKKNKKFGEDDLQVQEATNIVKDMILLNNLSKKP